MSHDNARGMNQPIPVAGDLSGVLGNVTVIKLQHNAIASTAPTAGQVLDWNSTAVNWFPLTPNTVIPTLVSGTTYTQASTDTCIIYTGGSTCTISLISGSAGQVLFIGNVGGGSITVTPVSGGNITSFPNTRLIFNDLTSNWMYL